MGKIIKRILIVIGFIAVLAGVLIAILFWYMDHKNKNYYKYAEPAGKIEKQYTAMGKLKVSSVDFNAGSKKYGKYRIWFPSEMTKTDNTYPLVIMANGTGVKASQYAEVFRHLASWGFIVAGNDDENSRSGDSSVATLEYILTLNGEEGSRFYGKIDTSAIGITGHSQGGVGAINAVNNYDSGKLYKAVFTASATSSYWAQEGALGNEWGYDVSKLDVPCFMVAGTGQADAGTAKDITADEGQGICPLWSLKECYNAMSDGITKMIAREKNKDHGDMLRYADGYMTAWFMYHLKGETAADFFSGDSAEILSNKNWRDVNKNV